MLTNSTVRTQVSVGGWLLLLFLASSLSLLPIRAQESSQPPKPTSANDDQQVTNAGDRKITVAPVKWGDVTLTQKYVGSQIHGHRRIKIRALAEGFLEDASIKQGQKVKEGELLFAVAPKIYQAKLDVGKAELKLAELAHASTKKLFDKKVATEKELQLSQANVTQAAAKVKQAEEALQFARVKAPFDGEIGRFESPEDRFVKDGEIFTTLTDSSVMWVYFNVPEARYLEYVSHRKENKDDLKIELLQENGKKFSEPGRIGAIEADFIDKDNPAKSIPFRADFPNPNGELRHGQTGTVIISETFKNVIAIPQKATLKDDDKRYVYVVDKDDVATRRQITIQTETDDQAVVSSGLTAGDKIVINGVNQVQAGKKVDYEKQ